MTEPDSPLLDKELGGRREPRTRRLKGARRPLPQAARAGTARPSFASGQMGQAAARPGLFLTVCATVILTIGPTDDSRLGQGPSRLCSPPSPLHGGERTAGQDRQGQSRRPTTPLALPSGVFRGAGGGSLSGTPSRQRG
jgi:hypothetical protein